MQYAVAAEICKVDPTQGIKLPKMKTDGIHTWDETEITAFEAAHAIGTRPRLAMALLLYTGQRVSDVIRMGRQHIRNGVLQVRQAKTGAVLDVPVHPDLHAIIDATPGEHLTFLTSSKTGGPYVGNALSQQFRIWCDAAELPQCSAHGLRKAACRRLAEAGCSTNEIAAYIRPRHVERGAALYKSRRSGADGADGNGASGERCGNIKCQIREGLTLFSAKTLVLSGTYLNKNNPQGIM